MKRIVFLFWSLFSWAFAIISKSIFFPEETALIFKNSDLVALAMMCARVVLPDPGGPQRIIEGMLSFSMARKR